jgi:hypothetical protein
MVVPLGAIHSAVIACVERDRRESRGCFDPRDLGVFDDKRPLPRSAYDQTKSSRKGDNT